MSDAHAQTWEGNRSTPAFWEIIGGDATGEDNWYFGREDIAGDGLDTFEIEEQQVDARSLYAARENNQLWLRLYTVAESAMPDSAVAFFFFDANNDARNGGGADDPGLLAAFTSDPSPGGYEIAVGVQGNGSLLGVWEFRNNQWEQDNGLESEVTVEVGVDQSPPELLGGTQRAYAQILTTNQLHNLDVSCDARLYVRTYDTDPGVDFGDLDATLVADCVPPDADNNGRPDIIDDVACATNNDCPARSMCINAVCVVTFECANDADCPMGEACNGNGVCQRVVTAMCADDNDCDGLLCEAGECVPCTLTPQRCPSGTVCANNGVCVVGTMTMDTMDTTLDTTTDMSTTDSGPQEPGEEVQGGPCVCRSLVRPQSRRSPLAAILTLAALAAFVWARRRA